MKYNLVITHAGKFHTDEAMAVAILRMCYDEIRVLRIFNVPENIGENTIVVDIGRGKYDHHQEGGNGIRDNGIPYASAGLIWRDFGHKLVSDFVWEKIDTNVIQGIDAMDNGVNLNGDYNVVTLQTLVNCLNPNWDDIDPNMDLLFENAVEICGKVLEMMIDRFGSVERAQKYVDDAINFAEDGIMVLPRYVPWQSHLFENYNGDNIVAVVFPSNRGGYNLQMVPKEPGNNEFRLECGLPREWRGKTQAELQVLTGIETLSFVHPSGFLCAADNYDDIMKVAAIVSRLR